MNCFLYRQVLKPEGIHDLIQIRSEDLTQQIKTLFAIYRCLSAWIRGENIVHFRLSYDIARLPVKALQCRR